MGIKLPFHLTQYLGTQGTSPTEKAAVENNTTHVPTQPQNLEENENVAKELRKSRIDTM